MSTQNPDFPSIRSGDREEDDLATMTVDDKPAPHFAGESSLAFLTEGYLFGTHRFERADADVFTCRVLGRPTTVMRGRTAARFFYEEPRMSRVGAMPRSVAHSLQDEGSVQMLSSHAHRVRKELFLDAFGHEGRLALARDNDEPLRRPADHRGNERVTDRRGARGADGRFMSGPRPRSASPARLGPRRRHRFRRE